LRPFTRPFKFLKKVGLIQELNLLQGHTRFDSNMEPHINLICRQCGNIKDLKDSILQEMIAKVSETEKFSAIGQRFDVYGIYQSCKRKCKRNLPHKKL